MEGELGVPLELRQGPQGTSHVASGKSDLLSSCEGHLGIPVESLQVNRASSRVEVGNSGFLSSCDRHLGVLSSFNRGVRPRLILRHGTPLFSRVVTGLSGLLSSSGGSQRAGHK